MKLANEGCGHMGTKTVLSLVQRCFTWPSCAKNVAQFCRSSSVCQRVTISGGRKVSMVERPAITKPFDSIAFDLVGTLPKAKGGYIYLLTYICLASRWPDTVPLKVVTATAVAKANVEIMCRISIPLRILADQG